MIVKSLKTENYRNLENMIFNPTEGINVIYGSNAQGKTNLIECLWLFTGGRSFRGSKENELIAFGKNKSEIELCFQTKEREKTIYFKIQGGKRQPVLNDVPKSSLSQIVGNFCAVVFSPDHLTLIKNGPEERRNFIDGAICQIKPAYASVLSRYRKILSERNALLKDIPYHRELEDTLDIWNERLAVEGSSIAMQRIDYIKGLKEPAINFYEGISSGKEKLSIEYKMNYSSDTNMNRDEIIEIMLKTLRKKQNDDIYCGYTTTGIHRDDIIVKINDMEARNFGSQGQQRSAVLALKLAEAEQIGEKLGENPVILLDDVLSELDTERRNFLLKELNNMQIFMTCCEPFIEAENIVHIENGKICL